MVIALAVVVQLGHVLANVVVERDATLLDEQRDRGRGELLRHRAHDERRARRDGRAVLEVRQAVSFRHRNLAVLEYADRATRCRGVVPREYGINARGQRIGDRALGQAARREDSEREECDCPKPIGCMGTSLDVRQSLLRRPRGHGAMEIPAGRSARPMLAITIFMPKSIMRTIATSPAVFDSNTANA